MSFSQTYERERSCVTMATENDVIPRVVVLSILYNLNKYM